MNIYLRWGRVPGAHDDTAHIVAADSFREAETVFAGLLHDEYSERDLDAIEREYGVTIFTNGCELLGELIEIDGQKLIRPDPATICGI